MLPVSLTLKASLLQVDGIGGALDKLHSMMEASPSLRAWAGGEKREQWMLEADTAATGCMVALEHIGLRAVARRDAELCENILSVVKPYLRVSGPERGSHDDNHYHGFNYHGVASAATLAAASLCCESRILSRSICVSACG